MRRWAILERLAARLAEAYPDRAARLLCEMERAFWPESRAPGECHVCARNWSRVRWMAAVTWHPDGEYSARRIDEHRRVPGIRAASRLDARGGVIAFCDVCVDVLHRLIVDESVIEPEMFVALVKRALETSDEAWAARAIRDVSKRVSRLVAHATMSAQCSVCGEVARAVRTPRAVICRFCIVAARSS